MTVIIDPKIVTTGINRQFQVVVYLDIIGSLGRGGFQPLKCQIT